MKKRIHTRMLAWMLTLAMVLSMIPVTAFAEETSESTECTHSHDETCGYVEAVEEVPCDKECTDTDEDGLIDHAEDCAYTPAVEGQPCNHVHDESCGGVIVEPPEKTHTLAENMLQALLEQYFAGVDAEGIYQVILEMDTDTRLGMIKVYEELLAAWTEEDEYNESLLELIEEIGHGISVAAENEQPLLPVPYQTNVMALEESNSSNSIELRKIDGSGEAFVYHSFHEITGFTAGQTYAFLDSFYGEEDAVSALGSGAILKATTAENGSSRYIKRKYGDDATVKVYVDVITRGKDFDSCVIGGLYEVPNSGTPTEYRYFCGGGGAQNCGPYYAYNYVKESLSYANVSAYLKDIEKQGSVNPEDYSVRITYDGQQSKTLDAGSYTVQIPDPASDRVTIVVSDSEGNSITAIFQCPLAICYDGNSEDASNVPSVQAAWKGKNCTISSQKPTRDGYAFINWTDSDTETVYSAGASISPAKSMKLLAQWKDTQKPTFVYTPTQVMTGDSNETVETAVKAALTVTDNEPVSECTVTVTVPSDFTKTPGNKNVTVTVKDKAGNTTTETCSVYVSSYVDISTPVFTEDTQNLTATLNNPGTDTVTESGFVWGVMNSPSLTVNNGKATTTTTASKAGDKISVTADNLQKGVEYYARAYITAGGVTYYSEEITIGLELPAYGTFTIKNNGDRTFTVTRSGGSEGVQTVYFRTVNGSAVGGTHFTHQNGTLTFNAGEESQTITITENTANTAYSGKPATAYSNADRTYSVEIYRVTGGGTLGSTTSETRTLTNDSDYTVDKTIYTEEISHSHTVNDDNKWVVDRSDCNDGDLFWRNNRDKYNEKNNHDNFNANSSINGRYSKVDYIKGTADSYLYRYDMKAYEKEDGWEHAWMGTHEPNNAHSDTKCGSSYTGSPISLSDSVAGSAVWTAVFQIAEGYSVTKHFPTMTGGGGEDKGSLSNTVTKFNNNGSVVSVDGTTYAKIPIADTVYNFFAATGKDKDKWYLESFTDYTKIYDTVEPQLVAVAPMAGGTYKVGDSFTVSLIFDEIVDSKKSGDDLSSVGVNTSWGPASYVGGADTNVLYFKGTVVSNASTTLSVNGITNPSYIKDMCSASSTQTASGSGNTTATVDTSIPNFTVTANGITNGMGKATIKINTDQTKTTGMSYVWSDSTTAPTTGWVELSSTELTTAKGSSGLPLSIRKESGSGASNGKWYLHVKAVYDTTGASAYKNICLDFGTAASPVEGSTPPTLTVTADNTNWAERRSISISAKGAEELKYRKSGSILWESLNLNTTSVTVEENGYYTFLLKAGDVAITKTVQVERIDGENPTASVGKLTSDSVESPKSGVYTKLVLPITYADAQSGVGTVQYQWTNSTTTLASWSTLQSDATTVTYTADENALATKYLHLKVTDKVGHTATTCSSAYQVISQTAVNNHTPKITITGATASWTNDMATLTWQLSNYSGRNYEVILPDGKTSTESSGQVWARRNGTYTVKVRDLEYGGENSASVTVDKLDFDPPSVTVSGGSSSWSKDNQTFTITSNDSQSGVGEKWYKIVSTTEEIPTEGLTKLTGSTITVSDEGEHYVYYKVYDKTGDDNTETFREANKTEGFTKLIKIDKTAPIIGDLSYSYQPKNLWDWLIGKESLIIHIPVTDNTSGVKTLMYTETPSGGTAETKTITLSGTTGTQTANLTLDADWKGTITNITCTDKAGNVSDSRTIGTDGNGIKGMIVEDNAPEITILADRVITDHTSTSTNGVELSTDYYNSAPNLLVTVKDDDNNAISGGLKSVTWKLDNGTVQNVSEDFQSSMKTEYSFTISDLQGNTGSLTVTVNTEDQAGNTAEKTVTVHVKGREATPKAQLNYQKNALTNLVPGAEYEITIAGEESGSNATITCTADENGEILLIIKDENNNSFDLCGKTIAIVRKGEGTNSSNSDAQELSIASRQAVPSVTKTDETIKGKKDGTLTGVDTTMEYSVDGGIHWTSISESSITGLGPCEIQIREKATESAPHGEVQSVTIEQGRTLTVTFESNGGSGVSTITGKSWEDTVDKPENPVKEGYAFQDWYQDSTFTTIWNFASDKLTDDVILYAKWTPVAGTSYQVRHYTEDLSDNTWTLQGTDNKIGTTGADLTLAEIAKSITGFTYKEGKVNGSVVTSTTILADGSRVIDLYYSRNTFTLTLNKGTGISAVTGAGSYKYGQSVSVDAVVSAGYTWKNWTGDENSNEQQFSFTMPEGDVILTANAAINQYTVTFDVNGHGTAPASQTINYGDKATQPAALTETGYIFGGWYKEDACENKWDFTADKVTSNITLYAKWTPNTYTVTYHLTNPNGNSYVPGEDLTTYTYGQGLNLPVPIQEGFAFSGWYDNASYTGTKYTAIGKTVTGDKEYYAYYQDVAKPSISVSANGYQTGENGWWRNNSSEQVKFNVTYSDNVSVTELWVKVDKGIFTQITSFAPSGLFSYTALQEGEHTYTFKAVDAAGNETETAAHTAKLDTGKPEIGTITFDYKAANIFDWIIGKDSLIIHIPVTDNTSGVKTLTYTETPSGGTAETKTITLSGTTGTKTVDLKLDADWKGTITNITCTDKSGNISDSKAIEGAGNGIIVEDNAPEITILADRGITDAASTSPSGTELSTDYYNSAPNLLVTVKDDDSNAVTAGLKSVTWKLDNGTVQNVEEDFQSSMKTEYSFTISDLQGKTGSLTVTVTTEDHAGNTSQSSVVVKIKGREATPEAQLNYRKNALTNLVHGAEYEITIPSEVSGSNATITCKADENGEILLVIKDENNNSIDLCGKTIAIVRKGDGTNSSDSSAQNLSMAARPAAPSVTKMDETIKGKKDGTVTGVDTTMEYRVAGGSNWTSINESNITDGSITGLGPCTIQIREKATTSSPHGEVQTVIIAEGRTLTVTFVSNGGSSVSSITGKSWEDTVDKPEDPTKEGYAFEGWYQKNTFETVWNFASDKLTGDVTLYAKWRDNVKPNLSAALSDGKNGRNWYNSLSFTLTYSDNVGVTKLYVKTDDTDYVELNINNSINTNENGQYQLIFSGLIEGSHTYTFKAVDAAGNETETAIQTAKLDKIKPELGEASFNEGYKNLWNWIIRKDSLIITIPVTETGSGIETVTYTLIPENGQAEGEVNGRATVDAVTGGTADYEAKIYIAPDFKGRVAIEAKDKAGNVSISKTIGTDGNGIKGILVEDNAPEITILADRSITDTDSTSQNGTELSTDYYNSAPKLLVTVKDDNSNAVTGGLKSVTWKLDNGTVQNVSEDFQSSMKTQCSFTINELQGETGTFTVTVTAEDQAGNTASKSVTVHIKAKELIPSPSVDYLQEKLTGLVPGAAYVIERENITKETITADAQGCISIKEEWFSKDIQISKQGGTYTLDSEKANVSIASRPAAPSVTKTDEMIKGKKDGTLTGVDTTMEYRVDGGNNWTSIAESNITDGSIIGLGPCTIQIRKKATTSAPHGEVQTVIIAEGRTLIVTFESNGGSSIASITGKSWNDIVDKPENPVREGYAFEGWYRDNTLGTIWNFASEEGADKLTKDVTLYAKWTLNKPSVTLTADGGTTNPVTGVIEAVYNSGNTLITLTAKPTHAAAPEGSSSNITYTYQWYKDGQVLTDMDSTVRSLALKNVNQSGTYTVKVTAKDGEGRTSEAGSSNEVTVNIAKAPITFTVSENTHSYDTTAKTAVVEQTAGQTPHIDADGYEVSYEQNGNKVDAPKDAGTYDVMVNLKDNNFSHFGQSDSVTKQKVGELIIKKKPITAVWTKLTKEYNGTAQAPVFKTLVGLMEADAEDVFADFTAEQRLTNAGTKRLTATLAGTRADNYQLTNAEVNFTVQKAPVTFAVADHFVQADGHAHSATVSAYVKGEAFDTDKYTITYRNAAGQTVDEPTDAGTYGIYAKLTDANYRHSGTAEAAARQIGVLTIYRNQAQTPKTYTVKYASGAEEASEVTGDLPAEQKGLSEGTLIYLPGKGTLSRTGYAFTGWILNGKLYQPGETFTMPAKNVTITACWKEATYRISGVVDQEGNPLYHAVVTLKRGSEIIGETTTDTEGEYRFEGVMPGLYNLITSYDGIITTVKVLIVDADAEQNATLPAGRTNSILDVMAGAPAVVVGNLEKLFQISEESGSQVYPEIYTDRDKNLVESGGTVEIRLTVEKVAEPDQTGADLLKEAMQKLPEAFDYQTELYLDLVLEKIVYPAAVSGSSSAVTKTLSDSHVILESVISLPSNLQNRRFYKVYRIHQNAPGDIVLEELTAQPNAEGEYFELNPENTELTIHARKYSVYSVAASDYVAPQPANPESSEETGEHFVTGLPEETIQLPEEEKKAKNSQINENPLDKETKLPEESDAETEKPEVIPENILKEEVPVEETIINETIGKPFVLLNVLLTLLSLAIAALMMMSRQEKKLKIAVAIVAVISLLILLLTLGFHGVRLADLRTILFAVLVAAQVILGLTGINREDKKEEV